jgi:23S rRNA pseudouridine2605 synthase
MKTGARKKRSPFRNPQPKAAPRPQQAQHGEAQAENPSPAAEAVVKTAMQPPGEIRGEKLHKMLAQAGLGSRRAMEERIRAGEVTVNGKVAGIGDRVTAEDHIKVGARIVRWPQQGQLPRVLLYHKPEAKLSAMMIRRAGRRCSANCLRRAARSGWPSGASTSIPAAC